VSQQPPSPTPDQPANPQPATITTIMNGQAWEAIPAEDRYRFLVGMAQLFGTGQGYIITQPCERIKWRSLVKAGYITLDEIDPFVIRLTDLGSVLFYEVLERYIPVTNQQ